MDQYLSDGLITNTQYLYIINKLEEEPECGEIQVLFEELRQPELGTLISEYCETPLKKGKKKQKEPSQVVQGDLRHKIYPQSEFTRPQWRISAESERLFGSFRSTKNAFDLEYRQVSVSLPSQLSLSGGNINIGDNHLKFVAGRTYWKNHTPLSQDRGIIFSQGRTLNGISSDLFQKTSTFSIYSGWNKTTSEGDTLDIITYGSKQHLEFQNLVLDLQEHGSAFEPYRHDTLYHLVSGFRIREKYFDAMAVEGGFSRHSDQANHGLYGRLRLMESQTKSEFNIFQAGSEWSNPLMDPSFRTVDSLHPLVTSSGRGEGGWQFRSRFPIHKTRTITSKAEVSTEIRWALTSPLRYRLVRITSLSRSQRLFHTSHLTHTTTESQEYASIKNQLGIKGNAFTVSAEYAHKFGHYSGTYPRHLKLVFSTQRKGERYKLSWDCRDLLNPWEKHHLMASQSWDLSPFWGFETGAKIPFEGATLSSGFYVQTRLRLNW